MTNHLLFSPVAAEYAEHYADLEFARSELDAARLRALKRLDAALRAGAGAIEIPQPTIEGQYNNYYVAGAVTQAVEARLRRSRSFGDGFSVGFSTHEDEDDDYYCLRLSTWFRFGRSTHAALRPTVDELARAHNAFAYREERWICLRVARMPVAGLSIADAESAVRALPETFVTVDRTLAAAYRKFHRMSS